MSRRLDRIQTESRRLPDWLRKDLQPGHQATQTDSLIHAFGLHTICESGRCPNRNECFSQKTATFMILGDVCTRTCRFCSVSMGRPGAVDSSEPERIAEAVRHLGLEHVVVTSVNRDDLNDEGASHFSEVIRHLKAISSDLIIEILTPDFKRTQPLAVSHILESGPDIFGHNVETVPRLYRQCRPQADYEMSLRIFKEIKALSGQALTKSGLMLGLGESPDEVSSVLQDLRQAGCDMLTLGQYLQSSTLGLPVKEYIRPEAFEAYKQEAFGLGFRWVESGPFVRSSYHAKDSLQALKRALSKQGADFQAVGNQPS